MALPAETYPVALHDIVVVEPIEQDAQINDVGIQRPDSSTERASQGVVVIAPGAFQRLVGHRVLFPSYAGKEYTGIPGIPDGTYIIMRIDEIWLDLGPAHTKGTE